MKKKLLSVILAVTMLVGMIPLGMVSVSANDFDYSAYCLCGYINGADYGMTEQSSPKWNEPGEYGFNNDGKLVVTFEQDSYIMLKTLHGEYWYAFENYVGDGTATSLYEVDDTYKEKMFVPANTEFTFTLTGNSDDGFTLGYGIPTHTHTHTASDDWMTDGRAHWLACDNADGKCELHSVEDYEIAFSSYEGPELKELLSYSETTEKGFLTGRQAKLSNKALGRTIIGLTQAQLESFGETLVIVGSDDSDNNQQINTTVDCAYTSFYDGENLIEAGTTAGLEDYAAFIILDDKAAGTDVTGYGYYRLYDGTVDDDALVGEALLKAPRTLKAVYDTTDGANTLNFYFDTEDHSGENKTVYENTAETPNGLVDDSNPNASRWGYYSIRYDITGVNIAPSVIKNKALTNTSYMFNAMKGADNISGAEYLDVSGVTDMKYMFYTFGYNSTTFNAVPDVSLWNTGNVTDMGSTFYGYASKSTVLNFTLDLSKWDVSNVVTLSDMFGNAGKNAATWTVTIPKRTNGKSSDNNTSVWRAKYDNITPAKNRAFTLAD